MGPTSNVALRLSSVHALRMYTLCSFKSSNMQIGALTLLNLRDNFVFLPHLENTVCFWMIRTLIQTVLHAHWLCTCIDRESEPCLAA